MASELSKVVNNCRTAQTQCSSTKQLQFSKTTFLAKLESDLVSKSSIDCSAQTQLSSSKATENSKPVAKKKRNRLRENSSFKGESKLELIKEDITDPEQFSPVERLNTTSMEQHRRSPRRMQREATNSDSDEDDVTKEQLLPSENKVMPPAATRKRTRTIKSRLMMSLHNQAPAEDYDGDYEDEVSTPPAPIFGNPDKVFDYAAGNEGPMTTVAEVHNSLKRSRSSDSSVETSNDSACLIPEKPVASSVRKLSYDQHSISSPSVTFNLRHSKTEGLSNSLKQLKIILLKGHTSSYESTV